MHVIHYVIYDIVYDINVWQTGSRQEVSFNWKLQFYKDHLCIDRIVIKIKNIKHYTWYQQLATCSCDKATMLSKTRLKNYWASFTSSPLPSLPFHPSPFRLIYALPVRFPGGAVASLPPDIFKRKDSHARCHEHLARYEASSANEFQV
jgi:hypothetical protein